MFIRKSNNECRYLANTDIDKFSVTDSLYDYIRGGNRQDTEIGKATGKARE